MHVNQKLNQLSYLKVVQWIIQIAILNTVVTSIIFGIYIMVWELPMTLIIHAIKINNIKTIIIMLILLTIFLILLLLSIVIYLNIRCNQLKYKNEFLMDKLDTINTARLNYHNNKYLDVNHESSYRRRLLSILDDILITLFHH